MPTIVPYTFEKKEEKAIYFTSLIKGMKVLIATEKPFAKAAVEGIKSILEAANYEVALLEKYTDRAQLLDAVRDADALIVRSDKITAEVMEAAPNLKIVVRAGAGYDNVDTAAAKARGIVVMNTPGQNSNAVAELAIALMIYISRNKFTAGDKIEIVGPDLRPFELTVPVMRDMEGGRLEQPRNPQMVFQMQLPKQIPALSILRRAVELSPED